MNNPQMPNSMCGKKLLGIFYRKQEERRDISVSVLIGRQTLKNSLNKRLLCAQGGGRRLQTSPTATLYANVA